MAETAPFLDKVKAALNQLTTLNIITVVGRVTRPAVQHASEGSVPNT